jgi:diaminopimelate decarboxylase
MQANVSPERWGLKASTSGELMVGNHGVVSLAKKYGTPLHVVNERRLAATARKFVGEVTAAYTAKVSVYYALKCNSVPAVVETIRSAGLSAEVMTEYELDLALNLGFSGKQIIVNGPCKTDDFLVKCLKKNVRLIMVDSLQELNALDSLTRMLGVNVDVLLRVNPDYVPHHMNKGTATASRRSCAFGLDLKSGEVRLAFAQLWNMKAINFLGLQIHIGTGIRDPQDYARALRRLKPTIDEAFHNELPIRILDVGGGIASMTTREFTTSEMLAYQAFNHLPERIHDNSVGIPDFAHAISVEVQNCFAGHDLPELLYEPGRCIASPNQFLLLTVHRTKTRKGVGTWLMTDGGLSTVTLPTYYEHHEVFLCNDVTRPKTGRTTLIGPACFAGDIIYKNKLMPHVYPGEVIAIMDSGAYFTALESSFGFPRPAILAINGANCRIIRARETYKDMISRDIFEEEPYEIRNQEKHIFSLAG